MTDGDNNLPTNRHGPTRFGRAIFLCWVVSKPGVVHMLFGQHFIEAPVVAKKVTFPRMV